jgi:hypothetical protein
VGLILTLLSNLKQDIHGRQEYARRALKMLHKERQSKGKSQITGRTATMFHVFIAYSGRKRR